MPTIAYRLHEDDCVFEAIRAQGPGGQNVNKVSSAVQLRLDIRSAQLPDALKERLLARADRRISSEGVLVIKAQGSRSLAANRADALARLRELLEAAAHVPRARQATRPTASSQRRRVDAKVKRGQVKMLRRAVAA
ncbi:MAG TPA: alternative ribosome rescue aminoacyl-tRNA hydrolase ArfB [Burkholderiaceae bacterium]|nr:alternative ribosome rescue aminoacyl-tRNA hydrolase ArfB [Burkholderiaceae bacterium]